MTLEKCIEVLKKFRWEHEHFLNENDNPFSEDIEAIDTALAAIEELKKAKKLLLVANADIFYYSGEKWEYEANVLKLIGDEKND